MDRDELNRDASTGEESFLSRWSRRKRQSETDVEEADEPLTEYAAAETREDVVPSPTDDDMPSIESLGDDDNYSAFLSPGVSEGLRRQALKRLFSSAKFNVTDGLDDYAEDYTQFAPLGNIVTADMKYHMERMLSKLEGDDEGAEVEAAADDEGKQDTVLQHRSTDAEPGGEGATDDEESSST